MRIILFFFLGTQLVISQEISALSIYFPNDSAEVSEYEQQKLDSLTKVHQKDSVRISLRGYANSYASEGYNLKLAQRRIAAIKILLKNLKIDTTTAVGQIPGYSWKERRVDVSVILEEKNIPDSSSLITNEPIPVANKRRMLSSRNLDITSYSELDINEKTVLFGIFFKGGTDKMLGSTSEITLRKLLRFLKGYPTRKILLTGHICCRDGSNPEQDGNNIRTGSTTLSIDRAKAVYDYLIKNDISSERLQYEGKAYREPLDWEDIKNRRVEITFLE